MDQVACARVSAMARCSPLRRPLRADARAAGRARAEPAGHFILGRHLSATGAPARERLVSVGADAEHIESQSTCSSRPSTGAGQRLLHHVYAHIARMSRGTARLERYDGDAAIWRTAAHSLVRRTGLFQRRRSVYVPEQLSTAGASGCARCLPCDRNARLTISHADARRSCSAHARSASGIVRAEAHEAAAADSRRSHSRWRAHPGLRYGVFHARGRPSRRSRRRCPAGYRHIARPRYSQRGRRRLGAAHVWARARRLTS